MGEKKFRNMSFRMYEIVNKMESPKINMTISANNIEDVLTDFRNFLRACGYAIDGDLIVKDYDSVDPDDGGGHA